MSDTRSSAEVEAAYQLGLRARESGAAEGRVWFMDVEDEVSAAYARGLGAVSVDDYFGRPMHRVAPAPPEGPPNEVEHE